MKINTFIIFTPLFAIAANGAIISSPILAPGNRVIGGQIIEQFDSSAADFVVAEPGFFGWTRGEGPENAIDGVGQPFTYSGNFDIGFVVRPSVQTGSLIANQIQVWTGQNQIATDPISFRLFGTNNIVSSGVGDQTALSRFVEIASGNLGLPDTRNDTGAAELIDGTSQRFSFANDRAYKDYLITFSSAESADAVVDIDDFSTHIGEVQLFNVVPEPSVASLFFLGLGVLTTRRRK